MRDSQKRSFVPRGTRFTARSIALVMCCAVVALAQADPAFGSPQRAGGGSTIEAHFVDLPTSAGSLILRLSKGNLAKEGHATNRQSSSVKRQSSAPCFLNPTTPASWFATDKDGVVDTETEVDNYPAGTVYVAPGFKYDCVAKDTDVIVMVYNQAFGTDPALVEKRTLQASPTAGVFSYVLTTPDGSPLQEGQWRVAFYQGKTPISTGEILLGGTADFDVTKQAAVVGTVSDLRTGQPVFQARVFVLKPGISMQDFMEDTKRDDIFVQTRTDAEGQFALWKPLDRNTQYGMLIAADGYKLRGTDRLIIGDEATSPVTLTIQLVKR